MQRGISGTILMNAASRGHQEHTAESRALGHGRKKQKQLMGLAKSQPSEIQSKAAMTGARLLKNQATICSSILNIFESVVAFAGSFPLGPQSWGGAPTCSAASFKERQSTSKQCDAKLATPAGRADCVMERLLPRKQRHIIQATA